MLKWKFKNIQDDNTDKTGLRIDHDLCISNRLCIHIRHGHLMQKDDLSMCETCNVKTYKLSIITSQLPIVSNTDTTSRNNQQNIRIFRRHQSV